MSGGDNLVSVGGANLHLFLPKKYQSTLFLDINPLQITHMRNFDPSDKEKYSQMKEHLFLTASKIIAGTQDSLRGSIECHYPQEPCKNQYILNAADILDSELPGAYFISTLPTYYLNKFSRFENASRLLAFFRAKLLRGSEVYFTEFPALMITSIENYLNNFNIDFTSRYSDSCVFQGTRYGCVSPTNPSS